MASLSVDFHPNFISINLHNLKLALRELDPTRKMS